MQGKLFIKIDTTLKSSAADSSSLPDNLKYSIKNGSSLDIAAYRIEGNHIKFTLLNRADDINGRNTWYCFGPHCSIEFDGRLIWPEEPLITKKSSKSYTLPGSLIVYPDTPIIEGGNFTWAEATHNFTRMPEDKDTVGAMIRIAKAAQRIRDKYGPVYVNSWYRPYAINKAVGGATNSRHLVGDALDIRVPGKTGRQLYAELNPWWEGGLGMYRNIPTMVHIDARGSRARWGA